MRSSTLVAVGVFAALVVAVFWSTSRSPERGITRMSFEEVDADGIDKVVISGKNPVSLLKKEDGSWSLENGKQADKNAVIRLVESIPEMSSSSLVTSSEERYEELEVDAEKGARVQAYSGDQIVADFIVGKAARGGAHVRVGDEVYAVPRVYASTFSRAAQSWLERKLFDVKLADVHRVEVKVGDADPYALVKKDNEWQLEDSSNLPDGFRFDASQARSLASSLVSARASKILDEDPGVEATGLGDEADWLAFSVEPQTDEEDDGREEPEAGFKAAQRYVLKLGKQTDDKTVYARVEGKPDVVTLAEYTANALRKRPTDMRNLGMMQLDNSKVVELQIQKNDEKLVLKKQGAQWQVEHSSKKVPKDFELDQAAVGRRIAALANARAAELAENVTPGGAGLGAPKQRIRAKLEDGSVVELAFGREIDEEDKKLVFASGNADAAVYLATRWTRDNLLGALDTFAKKENVGGGLGNIDPKALSNLPPDVRESLMKQMRQKQQQKKLIEQLQKQAQKGE